MKNSLKEALENNQSKPCSVEGCSYLRYRLYSTCVHHFFKRKLYGSAKSKAIRKRELQRDRESVIKLIEKNGEHKGIWRATIWLDTLMKAASEECTGIPGVRYFSRLHQAGVTGRELLITCASLYAYSYRNPKYFPNNLSVFYGLSHQIMTLVPLEYATTRSGKKRAIIMNSTDRRNIGEYLVKNLGTLFVSICQYIEKQEQEEHDNRKAFCEPFV